MSRSLHVILFLLSLIAIPGCSFFDSGEDSGVVSGNSIGEEQSNVPRVGESYTMQDIARQSRLNTPEPKIGDFIPTPNPNLVNRVKQLPFRISGQWFQVRPLIGIFPSHDGYTTLCWTIDHDLVQIDNETLTVMWYQNVGEPLQTVVDKVIPPVTTPSYVCLITKSNEVWVFNRDRGQLRSRKLINTYTPATSIAANDQYIFLGVYEHRSLMLYDIANESLYPGYRNQRQPVLVDLGPVTSDNSVFFASRKENKDGNDYIYSVASNGKSERWALRVEGAPNNPLRLFEETLFVAGSDYSVYAISTSGEVKWRWRSLGRMVSDVWATSDYCFVSNEELSYDKTTRYFNCIKRKLIVFAEGGTHENYELVWRLPLNLTFVACGAKHVYCRDENMMLYRIPLEDGEFDPNRDTFSLSDFPFIIRTVSRNFNLIIANREGYIFKLYE
ncbi:MAG: hypothetical protein NUW37_04340 [Planctomycetes bacterium]|nr:hypothetical protein [Planctomycetota bacterium]